VAQDRVFADDANRERVPGYWASNLRLSRELQQGSARVETYLALNNLLDQPYTDNLRTNAAFGRYYEPAAGRVLLGGVSVRF
jgi:iron complex outermembrane recepter protein